MKTLDIFPHNSMILRAAVGLFALALAGCHDCGLMSCDDGNPCTSDGCTSGGCSHAAVAGACDDGSVCTVNDQCMDAACVGATLNCDDKIACTLDSCDPNSGCHHGAGDSSICDDKKVCTTDFCSPVSDCQHTVNSNACDDGDICTVTDACFNGACIPGATSLVCDDGNTCTDDACVAGKGCRSIANTTPCDDGNPCSLADVCGGGSCVASGEAVPCDDQNPCTTDACNPGTGHCSHLSNSAECDDGNACSFEDHCGNGVCSGRIDCACAIAGGQPLPAVDDCETPVDDNCDGRINEATTCGLARYKFSVVPDCGAVCYYDEAHNIAVNGAGHGNNAAGFDEFAVGQLFDGIKGNDDWNLDLGAGPAQEWVAWAVPKVVISVLFPKPRYVSFLRLGLNNRSVGGVLQPPEIYLRFSLDGKNWSNAHVYKLADSTEPAIPQGRRGDIQLLIPEQKAQYVSITFATPGSWTFVDELGFD
jgi:hypothetical protein